MDSARLFADYQKALAQLHAALSVPSGDDVRKTGCIQYFEFTFELAWKLIKRIAQNEGLPDCNSPRAAFKTAFAVGWVKDEVPWLEMLSTRNVLSHTYSAEEALEAYDRLPLFAAALAQLGDSLRASVNNQ